MGSETAGKSGWRERPEPLNGAEALQLYSVEIGCNLARLQQQIGLLQAALAKLRALQSEFDPPHAVEK